MKAAVKTASFLALLTTTALISAHSSDSQPRTREFVVMGYQGIQIDLASGKGPYLRTLLELLQTPADAEIKTIEQLKAAFKTYPNIMDFADQVVLLGTKGEAAAKVMAEVPVPQGSGIYSGDKLVHALEHLTRGMGVKVTLKTGEQLKGTFVEYSAKRLWIRGGTRRAVFLDDILALEAPDL
jgi:hypothetical protein